MPSDGSTEPNTPAPWQSCLDWVSRDRITGWARNEGDADEPVAMQVVDNGAVIARLLANRHRPDLEQAGIGDGRYGFELLVPGGLSPQVDHVIALRRESDGEQAYKSPQIVRASDSFDGALKQLVASVVDGLVAGPELADALSFLVAQVDRVLQVGADADGQRAARAVHAQFRRRWGGTLGDLGPAADPGPRGLVIDDVLPSLDRDAGSVAVLSHIRALQRLGYSVALVAALGSVPVGTEGATLEALGVACYRPPFYGSVEDVLSRQSGCFDVIYLHRVANAAKYLALARHYCPHARILFSVADLHHVRVARPAEIEQRPELLVDSRTLQLDESSAAWLADAVVTHSAEEAATLRRLVPVANVHVVPWATPVSPTRVPFADRHGLAFLGSYAHAPNLDAVSFLVEEVMPLVWRMDPTIECLLVGSQMPEAVTRLAQPRVTIVGHVPDLAQVFDRVRLTVAPLRYGAGLKGKVLASFAAGVPCVMTPVAAEGLALPPTLQQYVGADAPALAALAAQLHGDEAASRAAAETGVGLVAYRFDEGSITAALEAAIGVRSAP